MNVLFPIALQFRLLVSMKHYPVENVYLYTTRHFTLVPIQKSSALFDNCLVYNFSLVSNNYLGSNNSSVENNFHILVNVLFTSALLFRLLSVWNIIHFRMSIFTLHIIFHFDPLRKSCALCDNCLVYITSLVSNNYLGSNNCSVENNFHLLVNVLFTSALLFRLLSFTLTQYHFRRECLVSYCSSEKLCFVR